MIIPGKNPCFGKLDSINLCIIGNDDSLQSEMYENIFIVVSPFSHVGTLAFYQCSLASKGEMMKRIITNDDGFTGLEAAIVLIAFVVVAAVFSYVVLGAGFFTTQKSQEVVQSSMQQASSSLEVIGNVYGMQNGSNNYLGYVKFTVGNTAGGTALDLSKMVVSYQDTSTRWANLTYNGVNTTSATVANARVWGINQTINDVGTPNTLLETGEQFILVIGVPTSATPNTAMTINLQPSMGAVFQIKRTVPAALSTVNIIY
jgi:flagellin FlaB